MSEPKIHISRAIWDEDTHEVAYIVDGVMTADVATQRKLNAVDDMYEALEAYVRLERDDILASLSPQELYNEYVECKQKIYKALRKARGEEE